MFGVLLTIFLVVPLAEVALFIQVGTLIGAFWTIALILVTAVAGAALARMEGLRVLVRIQTELAAGRMPTDELVNGMLILLAGVVLLTPGFLTDGLGFFVLWPAGRNIIKRALVQAFEKRLRPGGGIIDVGTAERTE
ncbi:MAG: FxsA family protein [Candidatus Omnitrophica bacterium]|nr:FxsA family protein [Candidatus Omnitrophota bacterium]